MIFTVNIILVEWHFDRNIYMHENVKEQVENTEENLSPTGLNLYEHKYMFFDMSMRRLHFQQFFLAN